MSVHAQHVLHTIFDENTSKAGVKGYKNKFLPVCKLPAQIGLNEGDTNREPKFSCLGPFKCVRNNNVLSTTLNFNHNTVKKGYQFSRPQPGCQFPISPWGGNNYIFPAQGKFGK
jgi:hypothetical protein